MFWPFSAGRDVSNPPCLPAKKSWGQCLERPSLKSVVFRIISRAPGDDHSRADPCLLGLGERHRLLWRLLGLSSLQGNVIEDTVGETEDWVKKFTRCCPRCFRLCREPCSWLLAVWEGVGWSPNLLFCLQNIRFCILLICLRSFVPRGRSSQFYCLGKTKILKPNDGTKLDHEKLIFSVILL